MSEIESDPPDPYASSTPDQVRDRLSSVPSGEGFTVLVLSVLSYLKTIEDHEHDRDGHRALAAEHALRNRIREIDALCWARGFAPVFIPRWRTRFDAIFGELVPDSAAA